MKKSKYLGFALLAFMAGVCSLNALSLDDQSTRVFENDETITIPFSQVVGPLSCTSEDTSIATIDENAIITPVADGWTTVSCADLGGSFPDFALPVDVVVNINGTLTADAEELLVPITEINLPFVNSFIDKVFTSNNMEYPYGIDATDLELSKVTDGHDNMNFECIISGNQCSASIRKTIEFKPGRYVYLSTSTKNIPVQYKESIPREAEAVETAMPKIKAKYYVYLNKIYDDLFATSDESFQEILINGSDLKKDLELENLFYRMDTRYGDDSISSPMFGGVIQIGVNSKIYDAAEIEFHKAFKIPTVKAGQDIIDVIEKYLEDNYIDENEEVSVELMNSENPEDEDVYMATISPKENNSPIVMLLDKLFPRVMAETEDIQIAFSVVQSDDLLLNNPKTSDSIQNSVIIGGISLIAIIFVGIYFNKKKSLSKIINK